MKALTLHRPWDWAMTRAVPLKDIENRTWKPHSWVIDERIALHAGGQYDYDGAQAIKRLTRAKLPETRPFVVVGTTRLVGWVLLTADPEAGVLLKQTSEMTPGQIARACGSPWLFGPYGWVCEDTVTLPKAIPCRGAQGLWELPSNVEAEVLRQEQLARRTA
jgi:hypothetical protein